MPKVVYHGHLELTIPKFGLYVCQGDVITLSNEDAASLIESNSFFSYFEGESPKRISPKTTEEEVLAWEKMTFGSKAVELKKGKK